MPEITLTADQYAYLKKLLEMRLIDLSPALKHFYDVIYAGKPSANIVQPETQNQPVISTSLGQRIAKKAEATAKSLNRTGACLKGVTITLLPFGLNLYGIIPAADAKPRFDQCAFYMLSPNYPASKLPKLPPGAVVIWSKSEKHIYGHISIALGDGREASDHIQPQMTEYSSPFYVYMPVNV